MHLKEERGRGQANDLPRSSPPSSSSSSSMSTATPSFRVSTKSYPLYRPCLKTDVLEYYAVGHDPPVSALMGEIQREDWKASLYVCM